MTGHRPSTSAGRRLWKRIWNYINNFKEINYLLISETRHRSRTCAGSLFMEWNENYINNFKEINYWRILKTRHQPRTSTDRRLWNGIEFILIIFDK